MLIISSISRRLSSHISVLLAECSFMIHVSQKRLVQYGSSCFWIVFNFAQVSALEIIDDLPFDAALSVTVVFSLEVLVLVLSPSLLLPLSLTAEQRCTFAAWLRCPHMHRYVILRHILQKLPVYLNTAWIPILQLVWFDGQGRSIHKEQVFLGSLPKHYQLLFWTFREDTSHFLFCYAASFADTLFEVL